MKKDYIIVTNDNEWVSTLQSVTKEDVLMEIEFLKSEYPDALEFYVYPTILKNSNTFKNVK